MEALASGLAAFAMFNQLNPAMQGHRFSLNDLS